MPVADVTDQVQTIAELAIAMAGFAGVVFVLDRGSESEVRVFRVTNLLALSFATMLTCVLHLVFATTFGHDLSNKITSGVLFVSIGVLLGFFSLPNYFRLRIPSRSRAAKLIAMVGPPITFTAPIVAGLNAFNLFPDHTGTALLLCLAFMMFSCAMQFIAAIVDRD